MKPFKVICINTKMIETRSTHYSYGTGLIRGEIYTVTGFGYKESANCYFILELNDYKHVARFRPVDPLYGELICETIEQQIELEKVIEL